METSILIAKILAVVYLSIGVGMAFNTNYYQTAIGKLLQSTTYLLLGGWMASVIGVVLVHYHNIWVYDWRVLVTVVGWMALIKGIMLLAFPKLIAAFEPWFSHKSLKNFILPMVFILGLVFGYFGFFF